MATVRDVFFDEIYEQIKNGEKIYIVSVDLGAPSLDKLRRDFSEHFINIGISEQNLLSVSAGLAATGHHVVAYGLNPFVVTRAYDQLRSLMGDLSLPITLCGWRTGIDAANAGFTHIASEVFGMVRMLPNIRIITPSDFNLAKSLAREVTANDKPKYVIFERTVQSEIYDEKKIDFSKGYFVYQGKSKGKIAIISNGCFVNRCRDMVDKFAEKSLPVSFFDFYSLPIDKDKFINDIDGTEKIVVWEEYALPGGLGTYVLEILSDYGKKIPVKRMGLDYDKYPEHSFTNREHLRNLQGIVEDNVIDILQTFFEKRGVAI